MFVLSRQCKNKVFRDPGQLNSRTDGATDASVEEAITQAQEQAESSNKFDIMKADMIPPYETLKTAMIKVQQDAELASERAAKGSKIPSYNTGLRQNQQNNKTPKFTGGCWDCSQPNCKTGHQGCRSPGELNFARQDSGKEWLATEAEPSEN